VFSMLYAVSLAKDLCSVERRGLLASDVDGLHVVIVPDWAPMRLHFQ